MYWLVCAQGKRLRTIKIAKLEHFAVYKLNNMCTNVLHLEAILFF